MLTINRSVRTVAFLLATVALAWVMLGPSRTRAQDPNVSKPAADVVKLQQERIATLREASKLATDLFAQGGGSADDVWRCEQALFEAQLEAAALAKERVQILQNAVESAKRQESFKSKQADAGLVTGLAPLEAKAYRLRMEIKLAHERAK